MKAVRNLPENFEKIYSVNLQKNKKASLLVNLLGLLIAVAMIVPMNKVVSFTTFFDMSAGKDAYWFRYVAMLVLMVAYIILHELVHGIAMKYCGTKKVKYGFTGMYAFAGSDDYYDKKAYIFIALAPVVLWGAVLAVINPFVPKAWFWVVYMLQVINISGAAGDLFITVKFSRMPKDILVKDHGVGMDVYSAKKQ